MVNGPGPLLVSVMAWATLVVPVFWLAKARACEEKLTPVLYATLFRSNVTDCGLPLPSSAMPIVAVRLPIAVGANVILMLQLALRASVAGLTGQLLLCV